MSKKVLKAIIPLSILILLVFGYFELNNKVDDSSEDVVSVMNNNDDVEIKENKEEDSNKNYSKTYWDLTQLYKTDDKWENDLKKFENT